MSVAEGVQSSLGAMYPSGAHVQVLVNGLVEFDRRVDDIEITNMLYLDSTPAAGMQFTFKYGKRTARGVEV